VANAKFAVYLKDVNRIDFESIRDTEEALVPYMHEWYSEDANAVVAIVDVRLIDIRDKAEVESKVGKQSVLFAGDET
jgi:predicted phosphoadenosine phosphosulfate sulfurtransferase